ncbi:uncharacterized protein LOC110708862 [Chenopodium quinoa]|uniref:uncharacterized protein LOC110708862 n=1 Tax=Chenopodium quinoa TaxID=63459 RepID=UPI000B76D89A|nr:uncharacterized protein LOC110708862 [Chenopodium quinoa]
MSKKLGNSIEKESGANAGSSGAATVDAGSSGAADEAGSPGVAAEAGSSGAGAEAGSLGVAAEAGSSGAAAEAGSSGAVAEAGSSGALVAEEKSSEKKKKKIKVVATKGKAKKVEKRVKEKHNVKFEDPDSEDAVDEVQKLKSVVYGTLRNRMSPSSVVNVNKEFSEDQLTAIRAIGFGSLEFLKVSQLPLQLGFWLVKHFDAHSCTLNIPDSDPFKITEQHVHDVLGLPAGGMEMDANIFSKDDKVINQWKKQFPKNSLSVNIRELSMYLKNHKSAGPMFKRNFVVLCVSTLMSGGQNKNVNHDVLRYLSNVAKIKDLNWSKFILDSLVKAKIKWDELPTRYFPGSLLFLMLLYVDHFVIEEVRAKRETLVLKGWTTNMLSSREKLEIFKGRLGIFDKNLKVVGPSGSKQPKMETSVPTVPQTNEDVEVDPKKVFI